MAKWFRGSGFWWRLEAISWMQLPKLYADSKVCTIDQCQDWSDIVYTGFQAPAAQRIKFKTLLMVANCIHQRAPTYLQELRVPVSMVMEKGSDNFQLNWINPLGPPEDSHKGVMMINYIYLSYSFCISGFLSYIYFVQFYNFGHVDLLWDFGPSEHHHPRPTLVYPWNLTFFSKLSF